MYCFDDFECDIKGVKNLQNLLKLTSAVQPYRPADISISDPVLYMYTSGTTGLPKAVVMRTIKFLSVVTFGNIGK